MLSSLKLNINEEKSENRTSDNKYNNKLQAVGSLRDCGRNTLSVRQKQVSRHKPHIQKSLRIKEFYKQHFYIFHLVSLFYIVALSAVLRNF